MSTESKDIRMKTNPRRPVMAWLVISQLLAVGSLIPWMAYAYLSFWAIRTGGSSTWEVIFVSVTFAYPIVVIVCAILSWSLYRAHKDRQALIVTSLFFIGPLFYLMTIYLST